MQRYFKDSKEKVYELSEDDSYHIIKVMRLKLKDKVEVVNYGTTYIAEIINIDKNKVSVKNIEELSDYNELPLNITLAQSAVKEQKMDYILQKSCELGVSDIIVLNTKRSIVKLDKNENKKIERWNKILKEASEQSKRNIIPKIIGINSIKELSLLDYDIKLLCTVNENDNNIKNVLSNININDRILFVVGPEGGFEKEEEKTLKDNSFIPVSLGKRVLRTETASSFLLSIINYEIME